MLVNYLFFLKSIYQNENKLENILPIDYSGCFAH